MDTTTATMSSVGQITIPRSVRTALDLKPGTKFEIVVNKEDKSFSLKKQLSFDEVMTELKELRKKYPVPTPDPRGKNMTVGEMSLAQLKDIKGDTWV